VNTHRADMWYSLLVTLLSICSPSLSLSTSLPNKLRPAKVIFLKMQLPYRLDPDKLKKLVAAHSKGGSNEDKLMEAFSGGGINENKLVEAFSKAGINMERSRRGKKTRDIGSMDPYNRWEEMSPSNNINYIQRGGVDEKSLSQKNEHSRKEKNRKILRPGVHFMSNARPSLLTWRELKVKETPIITAKPFSLGYRSLLKKKYEREVPVHLGYSRNFVEDTPDPRFRGKGSRTTWLRYPVNGLPRTLKHWQYPLKVSRLMTNTV